jgi:hypothetical protein
MGAVVGIGRVIHLCDPGNRVSAFTPEMEAELRKPFATIFGALKVDLPDGTVTLLDGAGTVTFGGDTYTGRDALFGVLDTVDSIQDGGGDSAPALSITLLPDSDADAADICSPTMQGSPVSLYLGAVDPATGAVIADPLLIFSGELDQPVLTIDNGIRQLTFECASAFERLFSGDEGARLADSFHKSIWPGETGLANATGVLKTVFWGLDKPKGAITYGVPGGFVGGSNAVVGGGLISNGYAQL